ncbi:MAG TPA: CoA-binding protein [Rhodospirillaceae bacterium]|nr:CoA-binding protein [Rhodospirillaceae bacterium]
MIGASDEGRRHHAMAPLYLEKHGYKGRIIPVNPKRKKVYKHKCYASVSDAPGPIDHALVMTPAKTVPGVIRDCAKAGVKVATVFSANFAEADAEGIRLQEEMVEAAAAGGVRIVGPNCMGVYCMDPPAIISPNRIMQIPKIDKGNIGVISQSGSLTGTFVSRGQHRGLAFSKIVSIGNECDVSVPEVGEIMVDDPKTKIILMFLETIRDADGFAAMARRAFAKNKPVVVYKIGRSEAAAEFTASHTGAIAGTDSAVDAFFKQHGVIRVRHFESLFEMTYLALDRKPIKNKNIAVIASTGGGGGMVVDNLGVNGLSPTPLPKEAEQRIFDAGGVVSNGPLIDITLAGAFPDNVKRILREAFAAKNNGAVIMTPGSSAEFNPERTVTPLKEFLGHEKPFGAALIPEAADTARLMSSMKIPAFKSPESCADAMRGFLEWEAPKPLPKKPTVDLKRIARPLNSANNSVLDESQCQRVFRALGIGQAKSAVVASAKEALRKAKSIGFPMVVKVISSDVPHKTEAGGVALGIESRKELEAAVKRIARNVKKFAPKAKIDGFLMQKMEAGLAEVLIGYRVDDIVGPTIVIGTGGILSEIYSDAAVRLAPVNKRTALEMIKEVKGLAPIRGYRGLPKGDLDALAEAVQQLSQLAHLGDAVADAEINPLIVKKKGVVAVDGLIVKNQ